MTKLAVAFLFLALNSYVYFYMARDEVIPDRAHFEEFPDQLDGWRCTNRESLEDGIIRRLSVTDYLSCAFVNESRERAVHLYVGYHERQTRDGATGASTAIHPPEHCLPGSGWDVIDSKIVPIENVAGGEAKRFVIAKGNQRSLVYFWYRARGRSIARSHEKILYMFMDRARTGRTDGSLVRFTVPIVRGDVAAAEATFREFARTVTPLLPDYVPN